MYYSTYGISKTQNSCITFNKSQDETFGDPLWHSFPIDSSECCGMEDELNQKQLKDRVYMSELKEIWGEPYDYSKPSLSCPSEDETSANTSLNESIRSIHKLDSSYIVSESPQIKESAPLCLTEVVPSNKLLKAKVKMVAKNIIKKGRINTSKLAEMISNSFKSK